MLNPVYLHTFRTLVETGHFTHTAQRLNMTQPGVSQHLKKLELACGHTLLRRQKKGLDITEQGKLIYQYARQLASDEQKLFASLDNDDPFAGRCKLACSGALALSLYPRLITLQQQHPELLLELEAAPNERIINDLNAGTVDVGLVSCEPNEGLFKYKKIGTERLCLFLPQGINTYNINAQTLHHLGLISHPDVVHYLSVYCPQSHEPWLDEIDIHSLPTSGYINQINQILYPVAKGLGFTVLPESAMSNFEHANQLQIYNARQIVKEPVYLISKKRRPLPARFSTVEHTLKCFFAEHTHAAKIY